MPYIKRNRRDILYAATAGELNYLITQVIMDYLRTHGGYQAFNDVIGALESAKFELYRRRVAPYEDQKKEENGDVY